VGQELGLTGVVGRPGLDTYRFIETPIRTSRGHNRRDALFGIMIVVGAIGYLSFQAEGLPSRAP